MNILNARSITIRTMKEVNIHRNLCNHCKQKIKQVQLAAKINSMSSNKCYAINSDWWLSNSCCLT